MSYVIRVFLRSGGPVTRRDIEDFIRDGVYSLEFSFQPAADSPETDLSEWNELLVSYDRARRPIRISRTSRAAEVAGEVSDAHAALEQAPDSSAGEALSRDLAQTQQLLAFHVERDDLSDEAWFMLDALEAFMAREHGGVIWAEGDAFYDAKLRPLVKTA